MLIWLHPLHHFRLNNIYRKLFTGLSYTINDLSRNWIAYQNLLKSLNVPLNKKTPKTHAKTALKLNACIFYGVMCKPRMSRPVWIWVLKSFPALYTCEMDETLGRGRWWLAVNNLWCWYQPGAGIKEVNFHDFAFKKMFDRTGMAINIGDVFLGDDQF